MPNGLWERLRGARRIEALALLALVALLALLLLRMGGGTSTQQKTDVEARLERMLSAIEGAGRVRAMVTQDADGDVTGALIVADGLDDVRTYLSLERAVTTLLQLDAERVTIIGRDGAFGG